MIALKDKKLSKSVFMYLYLLIIIESILQINIKAQIINEDFWVTNGNVNSLIKKDSILILGGAFSLVGLQVQNIVLLNKNTAQYYPEFPKVNGIVRAIIQDGNGGWYIGGDFSMVGDSVRKGVAHILSDNTISNWNPSVTDDFDGRTVYDLLLHNNVIYIAGNFTIVNGVSRNYLAAVDINGNLLDWNPNPNYFVSTLTLVDSLLFVGGNFSTIGGQLRNYLASLDLNTGLPTSWDPNPNNYISKIVAQDSLIFVAGAFSSIANQNRNLLAAFSNSGDIIQSWTVNISGTNPVINTLCFQDSILYIGGSFSNVNQIPRTNLAAVNLSGNLINWDPSTNNIVNSILAFDNKIFIGGLFSQVNNQNISALAVLDPLTGALLPWNASLGSKSALSIYSIKSDGNSKILVGGRIEIANASLKNKIAAINLSTNELLPLNISVDDGVVYSLLPVNNTLYFSGSYTSVNGIQRNRLAAVDLNTGQIKDWNPNANNHVYSLIRMNDVFYLGGSFTSISEQPRNRLAAVDTLGNLLSWNPNSNNTVISLASFDNTIYIGGAFTNVSGQIRNRLAAIDTAGNILSWNPNSGGLVNSIAISDSFIFVGGSFFNIGGLPRQRLAAVDRNGNILNWVYDANGLVNKVAVVNNYFYASGNFTSINGINRNRFVAINLESDILRNFQLDLDLSANAIEFDKENGIIFLGGAFNSINNKLRSSLASIFDPEIIPVELLSFTAKVVNENVELVWNTATESNNQGFEIQRSKGGEFEVVGYVPGFGTTTEHKSYTFTDKNVKVGKYTYRLKQIDYDGQYVFSNTVEVEVNPPLTFALEQNYPNPFNPSTLIKYSIAKDAMVNISVYNAIGEKVATLVNGLQQAGRYEVNFNAGKLTSGIYFYGIEAGNFKSAKKMMLLK